MKKYNYNYSSDNKEFAIKNLQSEDNLTTLVSFDSQQILEISTPTFND